MNVNEAIQVALEHYQCGDLEQAEHYFRTAVELQPDNAYILYFLGIICAQRKDFDCAVRYLKGSVEFDSSNADAHLALGAALQQKGMPDEAAQAYKKTLEIDPRSMEARCFLGDILYGKGQNDDAILYFSEAIRLDPNHVKAYYGLASALIAGWRLSEAMKVCQEILRMNANDALAYYILGNILMTQGRLNEAEACFRAAVKITPDDLRPNQALLILMSYHPKYGADAILSEHLKFARRFEEPLRSEITSHTNARILNRRIKIGYVSPDFKLHPVASFVEPVLISHSRDKFEVFCYSDVTAPDEVTERIKKRSDQWRNMAEVSDERAAELMRGDRIDILIDLAGHTGGFNRILLFARKPAPVQVSWIGYLTTTGLAAMDYRVADAYSDPPGLTERFYTEKLIRLPNSFLCYLPPKNSPEFGDLPFSMAGHITFGSFNNFVKITPETMTVWSKILKSVPNSRLIMKTSGFSDVSIRQYALNLFAANDIQANRISMFSAEPSPEHLKSYNMVDIGLDTFPFNGGATTCEALWMGVPVVGLAGIAYHSRVGVSLLSNVGLKDLVADSEDEYVEIAVRLANDTKRLQFLRENLRGIMANSPVVDSKRFTLDLEKCYSEIWKKWCESE